MLNEKKFSNFLNTHWKEKNLNAFAKLNNFFNKKFKLFTKMLKTKQSLKKIRKSYVT